MRKISDVIHGEAETIITYLMSGNFKPDSPLTTKIDVENGILKLNVVDEIKDCSVFKLFIISSEDPGASMVLSGRRLEKQLLFSLEKIHEISDKVNTYNVYLLAENDEDFYVSQLKRSGISVSKRLRGQTAVHSKQRAISSLVNPKNLKTQLIRRGSGHIPGLNMAGIKKESISESIIWEARNIYLNTGIIQDNNEKTRCLLIRFNAGSNLMSFRWVLKAEADEIFSGNLNYLYRKETKKQFSFTVSVVMAVYNVEDYLSEAIESIIQQDIGFAEHIQLILVDDGSPDGSGAICDDYQRLYPHNIVVIHKENGGVASARNTGLAAAEGKYVNFMDSDDILSENTFSTAVRFFDGQYRRTDAVTFPIMFFEGKTGPHWQNYKFDNGERVINLWNDYTASDMSVSASLFKTDIAKRHQFDSTLPNGEDLRFIAEILLEKMTLGVVVECCYFYRRRNAGGSLINTSHMKRSWYFEYFQNMVEYLFAYSRRKIGFVPAFIQNTVMMDLQWRFGDEDFPEGVLTDSEKARYYRNVVKALRSIDDQIILSQRHMHMERSVQAMRMKYGKALDIRYTEDDFHLLADKNYITSGSRMVTFYDFITYDQGLLTLEGRTIMAGLPDNTEFEVYLMAAGDYYRCENTIHSSIEKNCFGTNKTIIGFKGVIPIKTQYLNRRIRVAVKTSDNHIIIRRKYRYHKFTPFFKGLEDNYYIKDGLLFRGMSGGIYIELPDEETDHYEEKFMCSLKNMVSDEQNADMIPDKAGALTLGQFEEIRNRRSFAIHFHKEKPVWLISDRIDRAGDNGEALFIYLMGQKDLPADVYFVIGQDSPDYERIKAIGPTLAFGTEEHLKMHLVADLLVSSQGEDFVFTPYGQENEQYDVRKYYADLLCDQKFIFLQHGIIKDDLSDWLNRNAKNIYGFVTSAPRETESIINYAYDYTPERVWQTGLPRFDRLYEDNKKWIVICPTWRKYLRDLTENQFKQSSFYTYYAKLLSDRELHKVLQKEGYQLCLRLHPSMMQFVDLFTQFKDVLILDDTMPYRQMYAQSSVLITDYSSTAMEFAYMRKPVIYAQFDKSEMFSGMHTYVEGYFDYLEDGFGPVTETEEQTRETLIKIIKEDCKFEEKYLKRTNAFFPVNDYQNCRRIYEKLLDASGLLIPKDDQ